MHPYRSRARGVASTCALAVWVVAAAGGAPVDEIAIAEAIRTRVEAGGIPSRLVVHGRRLHAEHALPDAYERRGFRPVWVGANGPRPAAAELLRVLSESGDHGLNPDDYGTADLTAALSAGAGGAAELADIDLLLTDAFLTYGGHVVSGRVDPVTFDAEWHAVRREVDLVALLETVAAGGDVRRELRTLLPEPPGYGRLRAALRRYREIERGGGWPPVPAGPALKPGVDDPRVALLRRRLAITGDLAAGGEPASTVYDDELADAVRLFQGRHGLEVDGVVGAASSAALSVPVADRVRQLEINLERWRWLPRDLGDRYVMVNVPEFGLRVVEQGERILEMRVVVGRPYRRTPVFSDMIRYVVFNPAWEVPPSIAAADKLPVLRSNPEKLVADGFQVFLGFDASAQAIDPTAVDWASVPAKGFPYRLRQAPGPKNALGVAKFMFPNRFNVYLHDTPSRELFSRSDRGFSSGCIRLERPLDLGEVLLRGTPGWDRASIDAAVARGATTTVVLPAPVPVHLQYWTAWVDEDGTVQFRRDLYGRDARLIDALRAGS